MIPYAVVGILAMLLLNLIASNYFLLRTSINRIEVHESTIRHLLGTLYCFLLGVLLEWRTVVKLIKKETRASFSILFIPSFLILAVSCISPVMILMRFGLILPFPHSTNFLSLLIGPMSQSSLIQNLLAVVAGSMIMKGLSKNSPVIPE
jgi:fructose-specific phosphotransferase system IIC component